MEDKVIEALNKSFKMYATELGTTKENIQFHCSLDETGASVFKVCKSYQPQMRVTAKDLMQKKMDFTGTSNAVEYFIAKKLLDYSVSENINLLEISAMITKAKDIIQEFGQVEDGEIVIYLYNKTKAFKRLTIDELFI